MGINPLYAAKKIWKNRGIVPRARHLKWNHGIKLSTLLGNGQEYRLPTGPFASFRLALQNPALKAHIIRARIREINRQAAQGLIGSGAVNLEAIHWITDARVSSVVGAQNGDEGKGRITDLFAQEAQIVVRANAGNNARHTIVVEGEKIEVRHIPVGIIDPNKLNVIAAGTSADLVELLGEMHMLRNKGINLDNLLISDQAHLVFPVYRLLCRIYDIERGEKFRLGTTAKGTGLSFKAKASKKGLRICDIYTSTREEFGYRLDSNILKAERRYLRKFWDPGFRKKIGMSDKTLKLFKEAMRRTYGEELVKILNIALFKNGKNDPRVDEASAAQIERLIALSQTPEARRGEGWEEIISQAKPLVKQIFGLDIEVKDIFFNPDIIYELHQICARKLKNYIHLNTAKLLNDAIQLGKTILFEGAQGAILDPEQGLYPFVGSSSALAGGASPGAGIGPHQIKQVIGVSKAYLTTTGTARSPLPTEIIKRDYDGKILDKDLEPEAVDRIREIGGEFGVTVGPRRVCWLDIPMLRHGLRVNGVTNLAITHLDALRGVKKIKLCVAYQYPDGSIRYEFTTDPNILRQVKPIYEEFEGFEEDISGITRFEDLPVNAQKYVKRIALLTGTIISIITVGPDRKQTIWTSVMPG